MADLISRQAAIDAMCKLVRSWFEDPKDEVKEISQELGKLTSIQSKPKKGWWGEFVPGLYRCSECRRFFPTQENFCPNCGADMRREMDGRFNQ